MFTYSIEVSYDPGLHHFTELKYIYLFLTYTMHSTSRFTFIYLQAVGGSFQLLQSLPKPAKAVGIHPLTKITE